MTATLPPDARIAPRAARTGTWDTTRMTRIEVLRPHRQHGAATGCFDDDRYATGAGHIPGLPRACRSGRRVSRAGSIGLAQWTDVLRSVLVAPSGPSPRSGFAPSTRGSIRALAPGA